MLKKIKAFFKNNSEITGRESYFIMIGGKPVEISRLDYLDMRHRFEAV